MPKFKKLKEGDHLMYDKRMGTISRNEYGELAFELDDGCGYTEFTDYEEEWILENCEQVTQEEYRTWFENSYGIFDNDGTLISMCDDEFFTPDQVRAVLNRHGIEPAPVLTDDDDDKKTDKTDETDVA